MTMKNPLLPDPPFEDWGLLEDVSLPAVLTIDNCLVNGGKDEHLLTRFNHYFENWDENYIDTAQHVLQSLAKESNLHHNRILKLLEHPEIYYLMTNALFKLIKYSTSDYNNYSSSTLYIDNQKLQRETYSANLFNAIDINAGCQLPDEINVNIFRKLTKLPFNWFEFFESDYDINNLAYVLARSYRNMRRVIDFNAVMYHQNELETRPIDQFHPDKLDMHLSGSNYKIMHTNPNVKCRFYGYNFDDTKGPANYIDKRHTSLSWRHVQSDLHPDVILVEDMYRNESHNYLLEIRPDSLSPFYLLNNPDNFELFYGIIYGSYIKPEVSRYLLFKD